MPFWEPAPCKKVFLEFDLDMGEICEVLAGFTRATCRQLERNPRFAEDLVRRCDSFLAGEPLPGTATKNSPGVPSWHYRRVPRDTWSMPSVLVERFPGQTIEADCDQLVIAWGAYFKVRSPARVRIAATQPRVRVRDDGRLNGFGMAHAYLILNDEDADPSVWCGMKRPRSASFYGSGESASVEL